MGRSYILAIGVDKYKSARVPDLTWAVADAKDFHDAALLGRDKESVESRLLVDDEATVDAIREAIGDWLASASRSDSVVVFFAGHGAREIRPGGSARLQTEAFLLPVDADDQKFYSTAVSLVSELPVLIRRISAGNTLIILDCCLAGSVVTNDDSSRCRGIDGPSLARHLMASEIPLNVAVTVQGGGFSEIGDGIAVLSACGPNQAAIESDKLRHGVFTYCLLRILGEQRSLGGASIPLGELYARLVRSAVDETAGRQVPMLEGRLANQRLFIGT